MRNYNLSKKQLHLEFYVAFSGAKMKQSPYLETIFLFYSVLSIYFITNQWEIVKFLLLFIDLTFLVIGYFADFTYYKTY